MPDIDQQPTLPDSGTAQTDPGERFGAQLQARARRAPQTEPTALPRPQSEEDYKGIPFGRQYTSPEGETLTKYHRPTTPEEYATVPEGSEYMDPEGTVRTKAKTKGLGFTTQTLYDMAVNDKERLRALERSYPGKVRKNPASGGLEVAEGDTIRRPKGFTEAPVSSLAAMAAPVGGAVLGTVGAGLVGAAGGGMLGQTINDIVLGLTGVYDRSNVEQFAATGMSGLAPMVGVGVGRGVSAVAPAIGAGVAHGIPSILAHLTGATKEGVEQAIALRGKGVMVPPSTWAPEAPHVINMAEVFDPAFRTQKPLQQSAAEFRERESQTILQQAGVKTEGSLAKPAAAVPTLEAGEAIKTRALQQLQEADAKINQLIEDRKQSAMTARAGQVPVSPQSVQQTAIEADRAARTLVKQGFDDIQKTIEQAKAATKAGSNSGDMWWAVGEKLKEVRRGIMERAKKMYGDADQIAGDQLPNINDLPDLARNFLAQLPEGFESRFPSIVKDLRDLSGVPELDKAGVPTGNWSKEPVNPTFGQLHNIRSYMRQHYNYLDLTPDVKEGTFKFFANAVDGILSNPGATPELREAARLLRIADDFYRENLGPLNNKQIQSVMDGLSSSMPADPKMLFDVLVKEGRSEVTRKAASLIGPNLWAGVKAADVQEMLDMAKTLQPGVIDGRIFARQVLDRHRRGMLEAVHGRDISQQLLRQAQAIEMLEGRLEMPVKPGDTLFDTINNARQAAVAAKAAAKTDPLRSLNVEMKKIETEARREAEKQHKKLLEQDPLGFLYKPTTGAMDAVEEILKNEDLVLAAAQRFGAESPEFKQLQQITLQRILRGTGKLSERLGQVSPEVQTVLFPGITGDQLKLLAKELDFLSSSKSARIGSGQSIAAQARVNNPWGTLGKIPVIGSGIKVVGGNVAARIALGQYYKFVTELMNKPWLMRLVEKGLKGDEAARLQIRENLQARMQTGSRIGAGAGEAAYQSSGEAPRPIESRAEGGPVNAGQPYVVGERGPEVIVPQQSGSIIPQGQSILSDITPDPVLPGQQYAMESKRDPYQQVIGGRVRGGEGGAGGSAKPEILSPRSASRSAPTLQNQIKELEDQQRSLMQLRPMVPTLIKLGVTPAEMTKMNPTQAYQFIKTRSPQGMGKVNQEDDKIIEQAIEQIRNQRSIITDKLLSIGTE